MGCGSFSGVADWARFEAGNWEYARVDLRGDQSVRLRQAAADAYALRHGGHASLKP